MYYISSSNLCCSDIVERNKHTVIHVYYGTDECIEYEQAMVSTWYELMSNIGGILSVVIGGSIISFIELIYHVTGRFGAAYMNRLWVMTTRKTTAILIRTTGKNLNNKTPTPTVKHSETVRRKSLNRSTLISSGEEIIKKSAERQQLPFLN